MNVYGPLAVLILAMLSVTDGCNFMSACRQRPKKLLHASDNQRRKPRVMVILFFFPSRFQSFPLIDSIRFSQWANADTEITVLSVEIPELTIFSPLKPGALRDIGVHPSTTARNFFLVLIFHLSGSFTFILSKPSLYFLTALVLADPPLHTFYLTEP